MSEFDWNQVDFQQLINQFGKEFVIESAPVLLYSKKDKERAPHNSLIAVFLITGAIFSFIALTYFFADIFFSIVIFSIIITIGTLADVILVINVIKSNVYIKPLECWVEVHKTESKNDSNYYCLTYYPIFTGKCHPNEAKNVIFKLYLDQVIGNTTDITQIEFYFKINSQEQSIIEKLGFYFQYSEGKPFRDENINRSDWRFFQYNKLKNENFIAVGNWDHQFEWRNDLEFDFDKLHKFAPWIIQRWNETNIKTLTKEFKQKINWNLRGIESKPKLKPWKGNINTQSYKNQNGYRDMESVNRAISKVIGSNKELEKIKDIKEHLFTFKAYFRDLGY